MYDYLSMLAFYSTLLMFAMESSNTEFWIWCEQLVNQFTCHFLNDCVDQQRNTNILITEPMGGPR